MNSTKQNRKGTASRLTQALLAAAIAALVAMPVAFASGADGPVATKSASLRQQVKSLTKRVAALESRPTATSTGATVTTARPSGPAGGALTGTYPNPTLGPDTVTSANVPLDALGVKDLANDSVETGEIANDSVGSVDLAPDSVGTSELMPVHEVVGPGRDIAANGTGTSTVTCPPGEMLIAGGYAWQSIQGGLSIVDNAPYEGAANRAWVVTGHPASANTLYAWANCLAV